MSGVLLHAGRVPRGVALGMLLAGVCVLVAGCGGGSAPVTAQQKVSSFVTYVACLNKHGVQVQAARTGGLVWVAGPDIPGPRSPQAKLAERDCRSLVPKGALHQRPTAAQTAQDMALMLRYARCMRAHGVPRFPDPTAQGIRISPSSGIDVSSPAFKAAEKGCQKYSLTIGAVP
jgi:hypothetical protein